MQEVFDQTQVLFFGFDVRIQPAGAVFGQLAPETFAHAQPFFAPGQDPRIATVAGAGGAGKS